MEGFPKQVKENVFFIINESPAAQAIPVTNGVPICNSHFVYLPRVGPLIVHMSCAIICLLFSSTFHLFCAYSLKVQTWLSRFDYSGIAILISGTTFPMILYGFTCTPVIKYTYLALISVTCLTAFVVMLMPSADKPRYRKLRGFLFIIVGLLAGIPSAHAAVSNDPDVLVHLFYWAMGGVVYISGALLYVARIPERCAPGKFDFFVSLARVTVCVNRDRATTCSISSW